MARHWINGKPMSSTQRAAQWARYARAALVVSLGGRCRYCGRTDRLEIDHIYGREWEPRRTSRWQRVINYRREAERGEVQILCRSCNARKQ